LIINAVDVEGFGQTGPYVKRGGFDSIAIAIGGLMNITGPEVYNYLLMQISVYYSDKRCACVMLFDLLYDPVVIRR